MPSFERSRRNDPDDVSVLPHFAPFCAISGTKLSFSFAFRCPYLPTDESHAYETGLFGDYSTRSSLARHLFDEMSVIYVFPFFKAQVKNERRSPIRPSEIRTPSPIAAKCVQKIYKNQYIAILQNISKFQVRSDRLRCSDIEKLQN